MDTLYYVEFILAIAFLLYVWKKLTRRPRIFIIDQRDHLVTTRRWVELLRTNGSIAHTWPDMLDKDGTDPVEELENIAQKCAKRIKNCDVFIAVMSDVRHHYNACFTALGMALAMKKQVYIISDYPSNYDESGDKAVPVFANNVFWWDKRIFHLAQIEDAVL